MNTVILYNPIASSGRAEHLAQLFAEKLRHISSIVHIGPTFHGDHIGENQGLLRTKHVDLLVLISGDGSFAKLLPIIQELDILVWPVPAGHESLVSKVLGISGDPQELIKKVNGQARKYYYAQFCPCDGRGVVLSPPQPYFSMLSLGLESRVIAKLHNNRDGRLSDLSYLYNGMTSFVSNNPFVALTRQRDGMKWYEGYGRIIIANHSAWPRDLEIVDKARANEPRQWLAIHGGKTTLGHDFRLALHMLVKRKINQSLRQHYQMIAIDEPVMLSVREPYPLQYDGECYEASLEHRHYLISVGEKQFFRTY